MPIVAKAQPAEKVATREIKYNNRNEAMLVPKDGGPATPIFSQDGTPLTKAANETATFRQPTGLSRMG